MLISGIGDRRPDADEQRGHLDAAAGRAGSCSHKHQQNHAEQRGVREVPQIINGEPRSPRHGTIEKGLHPCQSMLCGVEQQSAYCQQQHGHGQHYLGVQRKPPEPPFLCDVQHHHKSQSATDRQCRGQQQHGHVVPVHRKAAAADQVKAGIVECGNRMEHTEPHCLSHRIILHKNRKGQHGSRTLNAKCHHQHHFQQPQNALKAGLVQRFLDQRSFPNADLLAGQQDDAYTQRGDPHAADLDQQQEDCLSESGKHCITLN